MPVQAQYTARSGSGNFLKFAQTMCRIVQGSASLIRLRFPNRVALLAVLTAAEAVCDLLPAAMAEQAQADAMPQADFYPVSASPIPGQDTYVGS